MQIAENLVRNGITSGDQFNHRLTELVLEHSFKRVIETGTYHGTGTTLAILEGLTEPFDFFSIEVNPENYKIALANLKGSGVRLMNGLSVGRLELPVNISDDFPEFVIVDHQPKNRLQLYLKEVNYRVKDNHLDLAMSHFDYRPELVLLDSAGHMGYIEFLYLIKRLKGDCYIALDDTDHVKHYNSMEYVKAHPQQFEIIWQVRSQYIDTIYGEKFGSAIIKYNHGS